MKKILLSPHTYLTFLFAMLFSSAAFSQDDIIMNNNDVVKAKVEEVGVNVIKYRKAENPDGPVYDMPKGDVYMIVYANGSRDVIGTRSGNGDNNAAPAADAPVRQAPPEMPVYEQPYCPTEGYIWTPGYWAWGLLGYYWVPGVWVAPPHMGYLWTPCYWGFVNGVYMYHEGYWGEHIGFYGGVDYGYGYGGHGYEGGRWEGGAFRYNTAVTRVDVTVVHTTYVDRTVVHEHVGPRAAFNGEGGVRAEATPNERAVEHENHVKATEEQHSHIEAARSDKSQYASENHGRPTVTAMNKPGGEHFSSEGKPAVAHPGSAPVHANTQPAHTNAQPEHSNTQPAHTNTQPEHSNTQPAHTNTQPEHSNTQPAHTNAQPEHSNTQPTNTNTQPQHGNTQPQHGNTTPAKSAPAKPAAKPAPAKPAPAPEKRK